MNPNEETGRATYSAKCGSDVGDSPVGAQARFERAVHKIAELIGRQIAREDFNHRKIQVPPGTSGSERDGGKDD
jgi:hypothetical protein